MLDWHRAGTAGYPLTAGTLQISPDVRSRPVAEIASDFMASICLGFRHSVKKGQFRKVSSSAYIDLP